MSSVARPFGQVYGLYCSCHPGSGIRYVGQTTRSLKHRMSGHRNSINKPSEAHLPRSRWVAKHGPENIRMVALEACGDKLSLDREESKWISSLRGVGMADLNVVDGGGGTRGFVHTEESRVKIGKASRARPRNPERFINIGIANSGKKMSEDARAKMSEAKRRMHSERIARGETWARAKVTAIEVRQIRDLFQYGWKQREIAEAYGLSAKGVSAITTRQVWKHVE